MDHERLVKNNVAFCKKILHAFKSVPKYICSSLIITPRSCKSSKNLTIPLRSSLCWSLENVEVSSRELLACTCRHNLVSMDIHEVRRCAMREAQHTCESQACERLEVHRRVHDEYSSPRSQHEIYDRLPSIKSFDSCSRSVSSTKRGRPAIAPLCSPLSLPGKIPTKSSRCTDYREPSLQKTYAERECRVQEKNNYLSM